MEFRHVLLVVGFLVILIVVGNISALFGEQSVGTSARAGEYLVYSGITYAIIKSKLFQN